jgi:hypothetical protein
MIIPAAMFIESAVDDLKRVDSRWLADQLKELHEAVGDKPQDFQDGYQLGVQTARGMVAQSGELLLKGADPQKVL